MRCLARSWQDILQKTGRHQFNKLTSTMAAAATQHFFICWLTVIWGPPWMSGSAKWISFMLMKSAAELPYFSLRFSKTLRQEFSRGCWGGRVKQCKDWWSSGMALEDGGIKAEQREKNYCRDAVDDTCNVWQLGRSSLTQRSGWSLRRRRFHL